MSPSCTISEKITVISQKLNRLLNPEHTPFDSMNQLIDSKDTIGGHVTLTTPIKGILSKATHSRQVLHVYKISRL